MVDQRFTIVDGKPVLVGESGPPADSVYVKQAEAEEADLLGLDDDDEDDAPAEPLDGEDALFDEPAPTVASPQDFLRVQQHEEEGFYLTLVKTGGLVVHVGR